MKIAAIALYVLCVAGCDRSAPPAPETASPATTPSTGKANRMHFEHHEFVLDLDPTWEQLPGNDPEQFQFQSKSLNSVLTISVMMAAIPKAKLQATAEKLLELRRAGESSAVPGRVATFGDQWVTPKPDEGTVEVVYAGYDNHGRIFRFTGYATTQKVVSFYCETTSTDNQQAKRIFEEAFRGFRFYIP